tara:strand:+ start:337 stop:744 length:408 start_codon:yes stop_codon:yes gene_type:complete
MVVPFDAAWSVLKALPEQQIDEQYQAHTLYPEMMALLPNQGMVSGTMHPVIQGMLARRGTADGSYRYNEGEDPDDSYLTGTDDYGQKRRGSAVDPSTQQELSTRMRLIGSNIEPRIESPPYAPWMLEYHPGWSGV